MAIKRKDLLSCSPESKDILLNSEVGDSIEFADVNISVGKSNMSNCCNYCAYSYVHDHSAKCPYFDQCSAHNRPDRESVCFYDADKLKKKNGYYKYY